MVLFLQTGHTQSLRTKERHRSQVPHSWWLLQLPPPKSPPKQSAFDHSQGQPQLVVGRSSRHPSSIIYKSFLPWLGHLTSLASISGIREPARTCCSILSVQLDLAYCMGGEAYYLGAENLVTPSQFSTFSWAILRLTSLWFMPATCVFISGLSSEPVVQLGLPFHRPRL